jgi:hypothetical protein
MKKKVVDFIFNLKLAVLLTLTKAKISFIRRDLTEFEKFGIKEVNLTALEALILELENIPSDQEFLGDQIEATQGKDTFAEILRESMRSIFQRAGNKFGVKSGKYRKFGNDDVSHIEGGSLSYAALRVKRVAAGLLADLASEGLTQAHIDELETNLTTYNTKLGEQEDAISDRDIATEDRAEKANAIYSLLVKYCETGRRIWVGKNEAKYNDYIIYNTPSGEPEEETPPQA